MRGRTGRVSVDQFQDSFRIERFGEKLGTLKFASGRQIRGAVAGHEEYPGIVARRPYAPCAFQAVDVRQPDVDEDKVVALPGRRLDSRQTGQCDIDFMISQLQQFAQSTVISDSGIPDAQEPAQMRAEDHVIGGARNRLSYRKISMRPSLLEAEEDERRAVQEMRVAAGDLAGRAPGRRVGDDDEMPVLVVAG